MWNLVISSKVIDGSCSCPARKSGYCNHVMALLLELAEYSLSEFQSVSKGIIFTSKFLKWVVPGETMQKAPVMESPVSPPKINSWQ